MQIKISLRFCLGLLFFLLLQKQFAQTLIPRFEQLGVNDGLPHSSVYSITQDKKGFMWFGTPDGLCRYDGSVLQNFKYNSLNNEEVINNFIRGKILEDKNGNIWYCNESGIYKWNANQEKIIAVRFFKKDEFANVAFSSITIDEGGSLWLFNVLHGIFQFNIETNKLQQYPFPSFIKTSTAILAYSTADNKGNIWMRIVSKNDPFFVFNMQSHLFKLQPSEDPPHAFFFNKENVVMAFENKLLYKNVRTGFYTTVVKTVNNKNTSFYSYDGIWDNYGRLWMTARGNGLFYYDEINNRFQEYHHNNSKIKSLPFDLTTCLYIDRSENLWIGIDGGGVAKLDLKQPKFNLFPLSEGDYPILNDYFTKCFYEDENKRIWFGSQNNGLNILDDKTNTLLNYHHQKNNIKSIPGNMVGSIFKDREANIWIGSSGGISLFNEKKGSFSTIKIQHLPKLYPDMNIFVYKIIQLKNGDLLAATFLGLVKISKQKNGTFEGYYFSNIPYISSTTNDVVETSDGAIYGTASGLGLYKIKPYKNGYRVHSVFLNGIDLRSVRIDEKDAAWLWIGTGKGLVHFNVSTKKYSVLNEKNGLKNSYVYGVLEDEKNNLWISTNGGLSYFDKSINQFYNYTYQDGLQSNEFNTQAFYKSNTNTFYFGGIKGFNWFKSKINSTNFHKPQVAITQMEVNNKLLTRDEILLLHTTRPLPYDSNSFTFNFAALDYTRPEANNIQYKLKGLDEKWITTKTRSARYYNLPPGDYTIIVKASNTSGIWSNEEKISFLIKSPFWKTWWFYLLTGLFAVGIIVFIVKTSNDRRQKKETEKLERQKALETERSRISQEMHDDIGSGLTQISLISEAAKGHTKTGREINAELDDISLTSRQLVDNIGEIIWSLNPLHAKLDILLTHLREQLNRLLEYTKINFKIDFPFNTPVIDLNDKQRRNILLVTKEIVHNCIKHSGANELLITALITNNHLQFIIKENGKGFDPFAPHNGNGLLNIRKRIEELDGKLEIISEAGKGTVFIYSFTL